MNDGGVYLTFDDGPIPEATLEVLDVLKEFNVKATFFCVGANVQKHPDVFLRILEEGHQIGNHTFNHLKGTKTNKIKYLDNLELCKNEFYKHSVSTNLFRPPHGRMTYSQRKSISENHKIVMWSVLSGDFSDRISAQKCLTKSVEKTRKGSIVLFHDSIKTIEKVREVLPKYIEQVHAKGLEFKCL